METKKLKINDLKVQSFVTQLEPKESITIGGAGYIIPNMALPTLFNLEVRGRGFPGRYVFCNGAPM